MADKAAECAVDGILDMIELTAFKLRLLTDDHLEHLIINIVSGGANNVHAVVKFAERHGGIRVAVRVARLLRTHGPTGSGRHLWNQTRDSRLVLVEAADA